MNIVALGIGKYGNAVVNRLCSNKALSRCVAICLTQADMETEHTETKFRVSTKLPPTDAIERIHGKLNKACAEADLVILIADPLDFANPAIIYLIGKYIQELNITLVAAIVNPTGKIDRKRKNAIRNTIDNMYSSFAVTVLRQAEYTEELNTRWLRNYTSFWEGRDTIQEQAAFHKWKSTAPEGVNSIPDMVQIGEFIVCRLLTSITKIYVNADKQRLIDVLSIPGYLHFTSVYASGENRYELIKWRASFNDVLLTSSHAAQGMLLDLTVPRDMTPEEAGKICLGIYSYADEKVNFYFNINHSECEDGIVAANVLATGTYDWSKEDH